MLASVLGVVELARLFLLPVVLLASHRRRRGSVGARGPRRCPSDRIAQGLAVEVLSLDPDVPVNDGQQFVVVVRTAFFEISAVK